VYNKDRQAIEAKYEKDLERLDNKIKKESLNGL
jgi:hypothetical protein